MSVPRTNEKLRRKLRLKKMLGVNGVCQTCAPMLKYEQPSIPIVNRIRVSCPTCGRDIRFDYSEKNPLAELLFGVTAKDGDAAGGSGGHGLFGSLLNGLGGLLGSRKNSSSGTSSAPVLTDSLIPTIANDATRNAISSSGGRVGGTFGFGLPSGNVLASLLSSPAIASASGMAAIGSADGLISNAQTITGQIAAQDALHSAAGSVAKTGISSLFGSGGMLGGIGFGKATGSGGGLAAMLPLLGVSLGSKVGGGGLGSIIGGVGGGLLGVGLTAAPAIFGAGGALASPLIAGLFSNPITAVVGGALLVGALIYGKNKARQKDEKRRTQYINDAFAQIDDLTKQVGSHRLDGGQALAQAAQIRAQYLQQSGQIKDKKTRGIALKDVSRLDDPHIKALRAAADKVLEETARDAKYVPEFDSGGIVGNLTRAEMRHVLSMRRGYDDMQLIKVKPGERFLPPHEHARLLDRGGIIPGVDRGIDDTYMRAPVGSLILNKQQQRDAQHFNTGGMVGYHSVNPLDFSGYSGLLAAAISQFNGHNGMYTGGALAQSMSGTGTLSASKSSVQRPKVAPSLQGMALSTPALKSSESKEPIIVNVYVQNSLNVDKETAGKIVDKGARTSDGRQVIVNVINAATADGEMTARRR